MISKLPYIRKRAWVGKGTCLNHKGQMGPKPNELEMRKEQPVGSFKEALIEEKGLKELGE